MWLNHNRDGQKANRSMNAAAVANDAQFMLHQLSLPIEPTDTIKARMHRAIRASGLSPRKATRIWYRHACTIAAHEYLALVAALNRHAEILERAAERNHQLAQQLRDAPTGRGQLAFSIDQTTTPRDPNMGNERL